MPSPALPAGPRLPRTWQLARYQLTPIAFMEACAARHGNVFTLRIQGLGAVVVVTEPADVRTVLARAPERFRGATTVRMFEPIMGPSALMFTTGAAHARQRQVLQPAFHRNLVERWSGRVEAIVEAELATLPTGRPIALREPLRRVALEVLFQLVLGVEEPGRLAQLREAITRGLSPGIVLMSAFPTLWRRDGPLNPGRALKRRRDLVHRTLLELVTQRRADPRRAERDDALSLLVDERDEHGDALDDRELRDQLVGLLFAGHDTTAAALAWAVERIAHSPHAQARLVRELRADGTTYLDATIRETLRMRSSIVDVPRTTTEEIVLGGHHVPAGTMVNAMLTLTQRRADLWERPLEFRPERFLNGRPIPYSYAPFGGGNRRCVGTALAWLQLQAVLVGVLRRYVVQPASRSEERARLVGMTLAPAGGARVILTPRC